MHVISPVIQRSLICSHKEIHTFLHEQYESCLSDPDVTMYACECSHDRVDDVLVGVCIESCVYKTKNDQIRYTSAELHNLRNGYRVLSDDVAAKIQNLRLKRWYRGVRGFSSTHPSTP